MKFPTIKDIAALVRSIKPEVQDWMIDQPHDEPSIMLTVGHDPETGDWDYQTGDNSYSGGAYGYRNWGIGYVTRRCNAREVAADIIAELRDLAHQ